MRQKTKLDLISARKATKYESQRFKKAIGS
jgi:uncharacterized DUF497 family protein